MNKWLILGLFFFVVMAIGIGVWIYSNSGHPVQTTIAKRDTIQEHVDEQGKTRLAIVHRITMPYTARLEAIGVQEGDKVERDQIVAQVVQHDLKLALDEAQASFGRHNAAITENKDNSVENKSREQSDELVESMVQTVEAAFVRLSSSQRRMEFAEKYRKDLDALFQKKAASENDVEQAEVDEVTQQAQFAQDYLAWKSAESMLKATELLPKIIEAYISRKEKTGAVLEGQLEESRARLNQMKTRMDRGTMKSPIQGVVLSRSIDNEQVVPAGTVLLTIGDLNQLEIEADVLSQSAGKIRKGLPVEIYGQALDASDSTPFMGKVERVYPGGFTKVSSLGVEQQRVRVIIRFSEDDLKTLVTKQNLGVGFRVRVRIITSLVEDVVVVPRSSVFRGKEGEWQLFVVRNRIVEQRKVYVGLMNDQFAEIKHGIEEGDEVVVAPDNELQDGMQIR